MNPEIVWLNRERTYAVLVSLHAHYAVVKFIRDGIEYEQEIERDDFEFWESHATEYE